MAKDAIKAKNMELMIKLKILEDQKEHMEHRNLVVMQKLEGDLTRISITHQHISSTYSLIKKKPRSSRTPNTKREHVFNILKYSP